MVFRSDVFAAKLRAYMDEHGLSQAGFASELRGNLALRIDQSEISRMLKGARKRLAGNALAVCKYASINPDDCMATHSAASSNALVSAVSEVWDGTREGEAALAGVIRALGRLNRVRGATVRSTPGQGAGASPPDRK